MNYLNVIKDDLKFTDQQILSIKDDMEIIQKILDKYDIEFKNPVNIAFYNHLTSAVDRIKEGKFVDEIDEGTVSELTSKSISISEEILGDIFKKYGQDINKSEIYLVAIYVETFFKSKL